MTMGVDELIAAILRLPRDDLARVLEALRAAEARAANAVRESAATYQIEHPEESMTRVTVPLPHDLAEQARDAGLLGKPLENILRKALEEHEAAAAADFAPGQERRLVRGENGYLVVEALPGEPPITTEEVIKTWHDMEW
jgi:hypothetical protein